MPATITIEDGTIVDGANSFINTAELDSYLSDRGYTAIINKEDMLVRAYDFMKVLPWCDSHDSAFTVEQEMKDAQAEIAFRFNNGFDPFAIQPTSTVKRQKVEGLEREFFKTDTITSPESALALIPLANSLLQEFLCYNSSFTLELA